LLFRLDAGRRQFRQSTLCLNFSIPTVVASLGFQVSTAFYERIIGVTGVILVIVGLVSDWRLRVRTRAESRYSGSPGLSSCWAHVAAGDE
jgi:hypothetical protein